MAFVVVAVKAPFTSNAQLAISQKELNNHRSYRTSWYCFSCCMPQFSDSFFEESTNPGCVLETSDQQAQDSIEWFSENVSSYYKSNVKIAHLNINSIQNKMDEVKEMLNWNIHPGYRIIRQDRKKGGGGLMASVREDLAVIRRRKLEPEQVESICLDVMDSRRSRFIICSCYRSDKMCKPADVLLSVASAIELMHKCRQEVILIGDFNLDMLVDKEMGRKGNTALQDFCDKFSLHNQISQPTRVTEKTKTLIDLKLASHPERFATSGNLHLGVSEHDLIYAVKKNMLKRPKAREIEYRSMRQFNDEAFLSELNEVPWESAYIFDDVDDLWDHWAKFYNEVLDKHAPLKKKRVRGRSITMDHTRASTRNLSREWSIQASRQESYRSLLGSVQKTKK
ncbi:hypothetical protein ACROYT_G000444 [Oculina patagonica]